MASVEKAQSFFLGDSCLTWVWSETISAETNRHVLRAYRCLKESNELKELGVLDTVPAYSSLAVYFDPLETDLEKLRRTVESLLSQLADESDPSLISAPESRTYRISVAYDGEDLERVATHAGLSIRDIITLHTRPEYTVAMIGFLPHYPYLLGLEKRLSTPRLDNPRTKVPAGSVAIGGAQTGIYPSESPGGWNLIGRTEPEILKELHPGDVVIFEEEL